MTITALIEELQRYNPSDKVYIYTVGYGGTAEVSEVGSVDRIDEPDEYGVIIDE